MANKKNSVQQVGTGPFLGVLLVVLAIIFIWSPFSQPRLELKVAVIPFETEGLSSQKAQLVDGFAIQLTESLAENQRVKVIAFNSSNQLKDSQQSPLQIAQQLKASHLLMGALTSDNEQLNLVAKLYSVTEEQVLAEHSVALNDEKAWQQARIDIVSFVGNAIGWKPIAKQAHEIQHYENYLRAKYHLSLKTIEGFEQAKTLFDSLLQDNPENARFYAEAAIATELSLQTSMSEASMSWAEKATILAPHDAIGYFAKGSMYLNQGFNNEAIATLGLAISHNTNLTEAKILMAKALLAIGAIEAAISHYESALSLDPLNTEVQQALAAIQS